MTARQAHGFKNELMVIDRYNLNKATSYTAKWDAIAPRIVVGQRVIKDVPTSIKTIREGGSVDMGDIFRHAKNGNDFVLHVDFYRGPRSELNIVETYTIYIESGKWRSLFEFGHYDFLRGCLHEITNSYSDDLKWKSMMAEMNKLWRREERIVHLAPKRDHKKQKRIQCTIPNRKFRELLVPMFSKAKYA
jgi:hypothetical protein